MHIAKYIAKEELFLCRNPNLKLLNYFNSKERIYIPECMYVYGVYMDMVYDISICILITQNQGQQIKNKIYIPMKQISTIS